MGIQVEFNPDLALRNIAEHRHSLRKAEECIPDALEIGKEYEFLKKGQRFYWLHGELPLLETNGNGNLSLPLASIIITEVTHTVVEKEVWTRGKYQVKEIFSDGEIGFNGFAKV